MHTTAATTSAPRSTALLADDSRWLALERQSPAGTARHTAMQPAVSQEPTNLEDASRKAAEWHGKLLTAAKVGRHR